MLRTDLFAFSTLDAVRRMILAMRFNEPVFLSDGRSFVVVKRQIVHGREGA